MSNMIRKDKFVACFCPVCGQAVRREGWGGRDAIQNTTNPFLKLFPCGHKIWVLPENGK